MDHQKNVWASICGDFDAAIPRQQDMDVFLLHCTGGFRGARIKEDVWQILPILDNGRPCSKGFMNTAAIQQFIRGNGFTPIAFQQLSWNGGTHHSVWAPILNGRIDQLRGPADLWGSISANLRSQRASSCLRSMSKPTQERIALLLDDTTENERLSQSIALSIRNMDLSMRGISDFYYENLVNLIASNRLEQSRTSTSIDQELYAHVQAFFMHLGAARDYLGALIASNLGKDSQKIDSMARLVEDLRADNSVPNNLFEILRSKNFVRSRGSSNPSKWELTGWLKEVTDIRNELMHRRPYGNKFLEKAGWINTISNELGLYRYFRPFTTYGKANCDVLDLLSHHYRIGSELFYETALASGQNHSPVEILSEDIISISIKHKDQDT